MLPHVRQAVALQCRLGGLDARAGSLAQAFDLLDSPAFLIDRDCRLWHANRTGDEILRRGGPLRLRQGRLSGVRPELTAALAAAATRAASVAYGEPGIIRIEDDSRDGAVGSTLLIYRLHGEIAFGLSPHAEMIVFLVCPDDHRPASASLLRAAFGLSAGEASLALALADGARLHDVAESHQVSLETVRSQLKAIFLKTGARRQADLIRVIQAQSSVALRVTLRGVEERPE